MEGMDFEESLLSWYRRFGRLLPWRKKDASPYEVLLSETMLQQTQVSKVLGYYSRFIEKFSNLKSLSRANEEDVLKLWEGLGYYSRARNLLKAAKAIEENHGGVFPEDEEGLLSLPGIGAYTSQVILAIAFHKKAIAVDGNLLRVYSRLVECDEEDEGRKKGMCSAFLSGHLLKSDPSDYNQALMDLGELVCLPHGTPLCSSCPLLPFCRAAKKGTAMDYPKKKAKTIRKEKDLTVFLVRHKGLFLIRKRSEKGLLASLYEFPNVEGLLSRQEAQGLLEKEGFHVSSLDDLGKGKHVFSHLVWNMTAYQAEADSIPDGKDLLFVTKEEIERQYSLPSAFDFVRRKILPKKS